MEFKKFAKAVNQQFKSMASRGQLVYQVDIEKEELYNAYLEAFPAGTNEIYKTNRKHDCNTCKSFIRNIGSAVTISNSGKITTVWDIKITSEYQTVANRMSELIKSKPIKTVFVVSEEKYGEKSTNKMDEESKAITTFHHLHADIPTALFDESPRTIQGVHESNRDIFARGLEELSSDSCEIVIELLDQGALYRGAEFKAAVKAF